MTALRELLLDASGDLTGDEPDPVGRVRRGLARRRRIQTAVGSAGVVLLAAAVAVPLTLERGGSGTPAAVGTSPRPSTGATAVAPPLTGPGVTSLDTPAACDWAVGGGELWGLQGCGSSSGDVVRVDPATGAAVTWKVLSFSPRRITVAAGHVFVLGQSTSGSLEVEMLDSRSDYTWRIPGASRLGGFAVTPDALWVGDAGQAEVYSFTPGPSTIAELPHALAAPVTGISTTASGQLWASESSGHLVRIDPASGAVRTTVAWPSRGRIVSGPAVSIEDPTLDFADALWADDGERLIQLIPSALTQCVSCAELDRIAVPGTVTDVVGAGHTPDVFLATPAGVYRLDGEAAGSGEWGPTASLAIPGAHIFPAPDDGEDRVYVSAPGHSLAVWTGGSHA